MTLEVVVHLADRDDPPTHYQIGSVRLCAPRLSTMLDPFLSQNTPAKILQTCRPGRPARPSTAASETASGRFWIASADRSMTWSHDPNGMHLQLPEFAECELEYATADSPAQIWIEPLGPASIEQLTTLILGPLLPMLMVHAGMPLLHAALLESPSGLCLIFGESGAGKSTVSAVLEQHAGWRRLGDDIAWLEQCGEAFAPRLYPQLKLPESGWLDQPPRQGPLSHVIVLERIGTTESPEVPIESHPIDAAQLVMSLLRHSVAARLYHPRQTAAQLKRFVEWAAGRPAPRRCLSVRSIHDRRLVHSIADRILKA